MDVSGLYVRRRRRRADAGLEPVTQAAPISGFQGVYVTLRLLYHALSKFQSLPTSALNFLAAPLPDVIQPVNCFAGALKHSELWSGIAPRLRMLRSMMVCSLLFSSESERGGSASSPSRDYWTPWRIADSYVTRSTRRGCA